MIHFDLEQKMKIFRGIDILFDQDDKQCLTGSESTSVS